MSLWPSMIECQHANRLWGVCPKFAVIAWLFTQPCLITSSDYSLVYYLWMKEQWFPSVYRYWYALGSHSWSICVIFSKHVFYSLGIGNYNIITHQYGNYIFIKNIFSNLHFFFKFENGRSLMPKHHYDFNYSIQASLIFTFRIIF